MTYLDHNAGTPLHPRVAEFLSDAYRRETAGNPSSVHGAGREARTRLDAARARVAKVLGRATRDVLFTASGSEACATAVLGLGRAGALVTTAAEHPCVLLAAERRTGGVTALRPGPDGRVRLEDADAALAAGTGLLAVHAANNETGVLQPVAELVALARVRGVTTFVDAVQLPGREPLALDADALALSAHKFGGPAGVGVLAARRDAPLQPLVPGHQEGGRRGGTPGVVLCEAAALALELAEAERGEEASRQRALRDRLEAGVRSLVPDAIVHGANAPRLCNTTSVAFPGGDGEALLIGLDLAGVAVSLGAACASGTMRPSPVLLSMGVAPDVARASLRVSIGRTTTDADVDAFLAALRAVLPRR